MKEGGIVKILLRGGIGVLPTDTIYGLVGSALSQKTVDRIYKLRRRDPKKPMIILIASLADLNKFSIRLSPSNKKILKLLWPGKISVILPCRLKRFFYLHRGTKNLAFRWPAKKDLVTILEKAGPLVAPSVNFEGEEPAKTIGEAKSYFGKQIDFYINEGRLDSLPSTLVAIRRGSVIIRRLGVARSWMKRIKTSKAWRVV